MKALFLEVPKGATARSIAPALQEAGIIKSADDFIMYIRLSKEGNCIKAGRFKLSPSMDAKTIIETVCGVPLANDKPFTIVEGWRIGEIDAALAKEGWIEGGEYLALVKTPSEFTAAFDLPEDSLEGYLYPETYMLNPDQFEVKEFIQRQITMLEDLFYTPNKAAIEKSLGSFDELVIMASMCLSEKSPNPNSAHWLRHSLETHRQQMEPWGRCHQPIPSTNGMIERLFEEGSGSQ